MKDSPGRFSRRVENYLAHRPSYPPAILDLLAKGCHLTSAAIIADIGSGTGMLTELFLKNGNRVFGVEPDPDMRAAAEYLLWAYPSFTSVAATAEATTLPDHSLGFVMAAQAFHWFDRDRAKSEFARILAPAGWVVLVWNMQRTGGTPFLVALEGFWQTYLTREGLSSEATGQDLRRLLQKRSPVYRWRLNPDLARQELILPFFSPGAFSEQVFPNLRAHNLEGLKGRVFSAVIAPAAGHPRYTEMLDELEAIFQAHQVNGQVTIEYDTRVYYGQLTSEDRPRT